MQHPGPGRTTKTLNTGVQSTVSLTAVGWVVYATLAGTTSPFYRQNQGVIPFTTPDIQLGGTGPASTLGQANTASTSVNSPTTAPTVNTAAGSNWAAGTYLISVAYAIRAAAAGTDTFGITPVGPPTTYVSTGTGRPDVFAPPSPPTGYLQVELIVPNLEDWHVTRYAVLVSSTTSQPSVIVYVDTVSPVALLDASAIGGQNSANADLKFRPGQRLICQWSGADLGATAAFSVYGEKTS